MNHVIDPTYFYDAIEEFSFDYTLYVLSKKAQVDDYGKTKRTYTHQSIRGSLQSRGGTHLRQSKTGNTIGDTRMFYCKSLYRINIGDILEDKNNFYLVKGVTEPYDEYGVRACELEMIRLTDHRDLSDYVAYLRGDKLV